MSKFSVKFKMEEIREDNIFPANNAFLKIMYTVTMDDFITTNFMNRLINKYSNACGYTSEYGTCLIWNDSSCFSRKEMWKTSIMYSIVYLDFKFLMSILVFQIFSF